MSATLTTPRTTLADGARSAAEQPAFVVVVVAPEATLGQCGAAIDNTTMAGATTVACVVDTDEAQLTESIAQVLRTVDQAGSDFPRLPIVLVGHGDAIDVASIAAEACGEDIAGLVLTHPRLQNGPRHAAA